MNFTENYNRIKNIIEQKLRDCCFAAPARLKQSIQYSLLGDGKRIRPVLFLAILEAYGKKIDENDLLVACAIECIHTYSLIHDDLPCMDNDDMRRGKPTNHTIFGETTALLAGDALLNYAYELLLTAAFNGEKYISAAKIISSYAGIEGMIGGQALEFEHEKSEYTSELLLTVYDKKCAALFMASTMSAAIISDGDVSVWKGVGNDFGISFQLKDDLLDAKEQADLPTLLNLWGIDKLKNELVVRQARIHSSLSGSKANVRFIEELINAALFRNTENI